LKLIFISKESFLMGPRKNVVGSAWLLFVVSGAALGAVTACGEDEVSDDSSSTGGKASGGTSTGGRGGSSGDAGDAGEGGTSTTGGSSGSAGRGGSGGSAGTDTGGAGGEPGGMGGDAGDAGDGGGDPGGMGGGGGDPINYWPNGETANGLSSTVDDRFHGVAVDASNNVYATGYYGDGVVTTGTTRQVVVAKYGPNAEFVTGFGSMGLALADLSPYLGTPDDTATTEADADPSQETGRDVALQSDGRIVVVGVVERNVASPDRSTPLDIFVIRFDATGMRDATFNMNTGIHILNPNGNSTNPIAYGVSIDSMNRIYVHAHGNATHATRTDQDRYVYRLNADGTLDTNFGTGGFFTFDTPNTATATLALSDNVRRGAVLSNGNVIVSGYTNVAGRNQIVLARTTGAGVFDTTFSVDGAVRLAPFAAGMAECYGIGVQADGSIVTTGYGNVDVERGSTANFLDMVSFRVRADGTIDPTWAGSGALALDVNSGEDRGRAILALPDDRIVVAGAGTRTASDKDSMLVLLDKDGLPAEDFNTDGTGIKLYGSFQSTGDEFHSVAQSPGTTGARVIAAAGYAPTIGAGNGNIVIIPIPAAP
jgi:uncharacterized delta-60 repeat protein